MCMRRSPKEDFLRIVPVKCKVQVKRGATTGDFMVGLGGGVPAMNTEAVNSSSDCRARRARAGQWAQRAEDVATHELK